MKGFHGPPRRRRGRTPRAGRLAGLGLLAVGLSVAAVALWSGTATTVTGEDAPAPTEADPGPRDPGPRDPGPSDPGPSDPGPATLGGVYVTAYSWFDNTPPGSSAVSHPVLHRGAGGTGTYADPVTAAVGHDRSTGRDVLDHPAGTRFYLPHLRRYVIVEDTCGDGPAPQDGPCHDLSRAPAGTTLWLDVWVGGADGSPADVEACAARVTGQGGRTAVLDPPPGLPVLAGPVFTARCNLP